MGYSNSSAEGTFLECNEEGSLPKTPHGMRSKCHLEASARGRMHGASPLPSICTQCGGTLGDGEGQCSRPGNLIQVPGYHTFIQGQTRKRNSQEGWQPRKLHPALPAYPQDPRNCMHQASPPHPATTTPIQGAGLEALCSFQVSLSVYVEKGL